MRSLSTCSIRIKKALQSLLLERPWGECRPTMVGGDGVLLLLIGGLAFLVRRLTFLRTLVTQPAFREQVSNTVDERIQVFHFFRSQLIRRI